MIDPPSLHAWVAKAWAFLLFSSSSPLKGEKEARRARRNRMKLKEGEGSLCGRGRGLEGGGRPVRLIVPGEKNLARFIGMA